MGEIEWNEEKDGNQRIHMQFYLLLLRWIIKFLDVKPINISQKSGWLTPILKGSEDILLLPVL